MSASEKWNFWVNQSGLVALFSQKKSLGLWPRSRRRLVVASSAERGVGGGTHHIPYRGRPAHTVMVGHVVGRGQSGGTGRVFCEAKGFGAWWVYKGREVFFSVEDCPETTSLGPRSGQWRGQKLKAGNHIFFDVLDGRWSEGVGRHLFPQKPTPFRQSVANVFNHSSGGLFTEHAGT